MSAFFIHDLKNAASTLGLTLQNLPTHFDDPAFRKDAQGTRDASQCLLDPRQLTERMLQDSIPARLGLQIHKFIWDPAAKGV